MAGNTQLQKLQALADRLLDRLADQVEQGELDCAAIKQICATMKDIKDIQLLRPQEQSGGVQVVLENELEEYSK